MYTELHQEGEERPLQAQALLSYRAVASNTEQVYACMCLCDISPIDSFFPELLYIVKTRGWQMYSAPQRKILFINITCFAGTELCVSIWHANGK